jgi:hypothetical protein
MLTTGKGTVGAHPPVELGAEGQVGAPPLARGWLRASRVAGQGNGPGLEPSRREGEGGRRKVTSPAAGGQTNSFRGNGRSARTGNRSLQKPGAMVRRNEPGRLRTRVCPALPLGAIALRSTAVRRGCSGSEFHGSGATPAKWGLHCQDTYHEWDARWRSTPTLGQGDYQVAAGSWVSCAWSPKSSSTSYPCPTRSADPRSPSGRCGLLHSWRTTTHNRQPIRCCSILESSALPSTLSLCPLEALAT